MTAWFGFLDWPAPIPFAHRGGAAEVGGENTLAAFARATALGYRYLETDGRVTADGVLCAFHDERLDRVTDLTGRFGDRPWSEVRRARVGDADDSVATMEELLDAFPDARFNIDPKMDAAIAPLVEALRRTRSERRVNVANFSDRRLAAFRRLAGPAVCTSIGPAAVAELRMSSLTTRPAATPGPGRRQARRGARGGGCVQVPASWRGRTLVDGRFIAEAHRRGLPVHVWTIDDAGEMTRLLDLGVDGIMTDRPSLLADVLRRRGQWVE